MVLGAQTLAYRLSSFFILLRQLSFFFHLSYIHIVSYRDFMSRRKLGIERLDSNILVPFVGPVADRIKKIARANGLPNTIVVRMIMEKGMEAIENGKKLELVLPKADTHAAA